MIIWKNTCGESWQDTIENGWEVSGKPGTFLFFIPKGALTHHLLKQAVVALSLIHIYRMSRKFPAISCRYVELFIQRGMSFGSGTA